MRVAAEAVNDGFVLDLGFQMARHPRRCEQCEGDGVNCGGFTVHERQIEKRLLLHRHHVVCPHHDGRLREAEGQGIGGESARRVAVDVARELIEHDHLRQPSPGRDAPCEEFASNGGFVQIAKSVADQRVERGRFLPPLRWIGLAEPEIQDAVGRDRLGAHGG